MIAVDVETTPIADRRIFQKGTQKVRCEPYQTPRLVCVSSWYEGEGHLDDHSRGVGLVEGWLKRGEELIFHNATFDLDVLVAAGLPWPLVEAALEEGRIHDSMVLDMRHRLATGVFDRPLPPNWETPRVVPRSLAAVAQEHCNMELDKDESVRLAFGDYLDRVADMPRRFVDYAIQDAEATYKVYQRLASMDGAPWDERLELQAAVAYQRFDKRGLRIDRAEAQRLRGLFETDIIPLQHKLVEHGLAEWKPTGPREIWSISATRLNKTFKLAQQQAAGCGSSVETERDMVGYGPENRALSTERPIVALSVQSPKEGSFATTAIIQDVATPSISSLDLTETIKEILLRKEDTLGHAADQTILRISTGGTWVGIGEDTTSPSPLVALLRTFRNKARLEFATTEFHLSQNKIRERLGSLVARSVAHKLTPTGQLSISVDDWHDKIPPEAGDLSDWAAHEKLKKILSSYLGVYSQVDRIYPRINVTGARSGRSSYSSPAVQQVPKRRHGIRSLFVAGDGKHFVRADYSAQEVFTLAQTMYDMGINGRLLATLQARQDVHAKTASTMLGISVNEVTKKQRQHAKATVFGVPGGLGAARLKDYARKTFGVSWSLDEAKAQREQFLRTYPDIDEYLQKNRRSFAQSLFETSGCSPAYWKVRVGMSEGSHWELRLRMQASRETDVRQAFYRAERRGLVTLRTGFVRRGCSFTEGANTGFQGLAAAVTKRAVWLAERAGLRVVLVVHDELVVESERPEQDARTLSESMKQAFIDVCPDCGPYAQVEVSQPLERWGEATDKDGNEL